jgi:hypothetical protein
MTRPPLRLTPMIEEICQAIFKAEARIVEVYPDATRPGYFPEVWTIYIGPRAYGRLRAEIGLAPCQEYVVGRVYIEPDGTEVRQRVRGRVDCETILGIRVIEDPQGPLDLWRVCNPDGSTACFGGIS